jgi:hypothetical protein
MKSNRLAAGLASLILAAFPISGRAQVAGFQAGIAQPRAVIPPVQAPAVAVNGTFRGVPTPVPFQPIFPGVQVPLVPTFPTMIIPNTVLVPGQTFIPAPTILPTPVVIIQPGPVLLPNVPVIPVNRPGPPLFGMSRVELIRRLGQPSTTIITSTGETLYFPNGVTVIIQNGQVVSPK